MVSKWWWHSLSAGYARNLGLACWSELTVGGYLHILSEGLNPLGYGGGYLFVLGILRHLFVLLWRRHAVILLGNLVHFFYRGYVRTFWTQHYFILLDVLLVQNNLRLLIWNVDFILDGIQRIIYRLNVFGCLVRYTHRFWWNSTIGEGFKLFDYSFWWFWGCSIELGCLGLV